MIERVWLARATRDGAVSYAAYFRRAVLPDLQKIHGYRGATVMEREVDGAIEIVVTTRWESLQAIRAFAGDDMDRAVVHADAATILLDFDRAVKHYGVVVRDGDG
jgi:heme-degrading monooxygenase HmoA